MTNYDAIKAMSVEDMAAYICKHDDDLLDSICGSLICPYGDDAEQYNCIDCVRRWLMSEEG